MPLKPLATDASGGDWMRALRANPGGARHPEAPCVRCGALTARRAIAAVGVRVPHAGDNDFVPDRVPWCDDCEAKRNRRQLEQIAGNDAVLPRLRQDARQQLAAMAVEEVAGDPVGAGS